MNTGKTCSLLSSAKVWQFCPEARGGGGNSRELLTGHTVTLTGVVSGPWVECADHYGNIIWIDENHVSHAE